MSEASSQQESRPQSVLIRPWPKVVFLYPTFIISTIFWFIQLLQDPSTPAEGATAVGTSILGNIWVTVFFVNLLVFSFDFSRIKSITIILLIAAVLLGLGWADVLGNVGQVFDKVDIQMNTQFYGFMSGFLALVMLLVLINTRFNYYEVNHREILHHHGYLGDITRMPTQGLHLNKEIYDLMEYLLLRSGRLIFYASGKREAIVIDNVINVNRVETHIKDLLSVVAVRMTDEPDIS